LLKIFSIFKSIQGESTRAGLPCTFIRLAGCPLRCSYCDTTKARDATGHPMEIGAILDKIASLDCGLVEVTGGEPLAQAEAIDLLQCLCDDGYDVMLETSGAFSIEHVDPRVRIIMDIKCPESKMAHQMDMDNLNYLVPGHHEVKFVVSSRSDFDWAGRLVEEKKLDKRIERLVSPVPTKVSPKALAEWILQSPVRFRLQLQLHNVIWPNAKGEK
jgi:7-carboxy-7-deazaguanine synthase